MSAITLQLPQHAQLSHNAKRCWIAGFEAFAEISMDATKCGVPRLGSVTLGLTRFGSNLDLDTERPPTDSIVPIMRFVSFKG